MLNSVVKLSRVRPGFDADHLLTFKVALSGSNYARRARARRVRVGSAGAPARRRPACGTRRSRRSSRSAAQRGAQRLRDRRPAAGARADADRRPAPRLAELFPDDEHSDRRRDAASGATDDAPRRAGRASSTARWRSGSGRTRTRSTAASAPTAGFDSGSWFRIVGVVDDVRHVSLSRDPVTEMYRPIAQTAMSIFTLVVRTDREPASLAPSARAAVQAIDPNLPIYDVRTMEDRIAGSFAQTRGTMLLLLVTAALAAALSGVAIYGSIWYSVSQRIPGDRRAARARRQPRVGVRARCCGARSSLTGIGALIGVGGALAGGRLIAGPAVRHPRRRSGDARGRRRRDDGPGASSPGIVPGAARDERRSDDRAEKRVGCVVRPA